MPQSPDDEQQPFMPQGVWFGSSAVQLFCVSLHELKQLPPNTGRQGSPACWVQLPEPLQESGPLQKTPSSQADPTGSLAVQLSVLSLQSSLQSPSPSPTCAAHGLPLCEQVPFWQVSVPLQKRPSLHEVPLGSFPVQASALSLQVSEQSLSPSGPGQGSPAC